jgi:hypothetical protein
VTDRSSKLPTSGAAHELPYIDEHALRIDASSATVWSALERFVDTEIGAAKLEWLGHLLGTDPPTGFAVAERRAHRHIALVGRHRFSHYRLVFELDDEPDGRTVLRARTYARFPGPHGRVYRALVIGTRLHVLATRGMLHAIRRRALAD